MSAERIKRNVPYSEIIDLFQQRCDAHLAMGLSDVYSIMKGS